MYVLLQILVVVALLVMALAVAGPPPNLEKDETPNPAMLGFLAVGAIFFLASFLPGLAVQVRRFHDQNLSGWLVLLGLIPYIGGIIVLVFMCIDGTKGPNQYGEDPKGQIDPAVFA